MRWDIWLAQPRTADSLRTILRMAACLGAIWTLAVFYGLWSTENGLVDTQATMVTRQKQVAGMAVSLRQKRRDALKADQLRTSAPDGPGSAEFTNEIIALANTAGAVVTGARIGGNDVAAAPTPAAPPAPTASGGATVTPTPAAPAAGPEGGWAKAPLECTVEGRYEALMRFMEGLASSPRLFDIASVQMIRTNIDPRTGALRLQMKFSGTLYGLPEKR